MATKKDLERNTGMIVTIIVARIGAIATISAAYFSYSAGFREKQLEIGATQTAEASQPIVETVVVTQPVMVTQPVELKLEPAPTLTPHPLMVDAMDGLSNWIPSFCDDKCAGENGRSSVLVTPVPGQTDGALEILYDLRHAGWVLISRTIDSQILSGTSGLRFAYRGVGAANTIELKLVLKYPGDAGATDFGASWNAATSTADSWATVQALYSTDFTCWWPQELCSKHNHTLDLESVVRIEIAISNKPQDTTGLGRITFDDLVGIAR